MTAPDLHPDMPAWAETIRQAQNDLTPVSAETEYGPDGTEPVVIVSIAGLPAFTFRRDEFLHWLHQAGCDVLGELQRQRAT